MDRILAGLILVCIGGLGMARLIWLRGDLNQQRRFLFEFSERLRHYVDSGGADHESYGWLIRTSDKMQSRLGSLGVLSAFRRPYDNLVFRNYPVVLNLLPELRQWAPSESVPARLFYEYANMLQSTLLRYEGWLDRRTERIGRDLRNPIKWFKIGVQLVIFSPLLLIRSLGLTLLPEHDRLARSIGGRIIVAVAGFTALISSIVTILVGGQDAIGIVRTALSAFP